MLDFKGHQLQPGFRPSLIHEDLNIGLQLLADSKIPKCHWKICWTRKGVFDFSVGYLSCKNKWFNVDPRYLEHLSLCRRSMSMNVWLSLAWEGSNLTFITFIGLVLILVCFLKGFIRICLYCCRLCECKRLIWTKTPYPHCEGQICPTPGRS